MAIMPAPRKGETDETCTRWRVIVRDIQGKQIWRTLSGTREDAAQFEEEFNDAKSTKVAPPEIRQEKFEHTIREYMDEYLPGKWNEGRQLPTSASTLLNYKFALGFVPNDLRAMYTSQITLKELEQRVFYPMVEAGKSRDTINRVVRHLRPIFKRARQRRQCTENPLAEYVFNRRTAPPKRVIRKAGLSEAQILKIVAEAGPVLRELFELRVRRGLRLNEALGLRKEDVDLRARTITVRGSWNYKAVDTLDGVKGIWEPATKTGSEPRTYPLDDALVECLRRQMAYSSSRWLFGTNRKTSTRPMGYRPLARAWAAVLKQAGVPYCALSSARSTFASLAKSAGYSSHDVGSAMGHAAGSRTVDRNYKKELPEQTRKVLDSVSLVLTPKPKQQLPSNEPATQVH